MCHAKSATSAATAIHAQAGVRAALWEGGGVSAFTTSTVRMMVSVLTTVTVSCRVRSRHTVRSRSTVTVSGRSRMTTVSRTITESMVCFRLTVASVRASVVAVALVTLLLVLQLVKHRAIAAMRATISLLDGFL